MVSKDERRPLGTTDCRMPLSGSTQNVALVIFFGVSLLKVLLVPSYRSTDFDVHRNWLSITHHLPVNEWYTADHSRHTLDYPPLFALFEKSISKLAAVLWGDSWVCLALLKDDNNVPDDACVWFCRASVIVSDIVLLVAVTVFVCSTSSSAKTRLHGKEVALITLTNAGLLILDHVHFQYNGFLLGLLILSITFIEKRRTTITLAGAFLFGSLIMMKHLYLPLGLVYFIFLLRHHCTSIVRFIILAVVTITSLGLPLVPFLLSTQPMTRDGVLQHGAQILSRLFPFGRGLVHAYWAGNAWGLYMGVDRVLNLGCRLLFGSEFVVDGKRLGRNGGGSTDGLVNDVPPAILPAVSPLFCIAFIVLFSAPVVLNLWNSKRSKRRKHLFTRAIASVAFTTFMFGYHVHEKAIMTSVLLYGLVSFENIELARMFLRLSVVGHFSLLPLLFKKQELVIKVALWILHMCLSKHLLMVRFGRRLVTQWDWVVFGGLIAVVIFVEVIHPVFLGGVEKLQFIPLMLTSMVTAILNAILFARHFALLQK